MDDTQKDIVEKFGSYYQRKLRDVAWSLNEMKSSDDLRLIADNIHGLADDMVKSAKSWVFAYEKPGKQKENDEEV